VRNRVIIWITHSIGVCKLEFYKTATDEVPFYEQWYRKDGDPEVCGHPELPLSFDPSMICAKCRMQYKKNGWNALCAINGSTRTVFICKHSFFPRWNSFDLPYIQMFRWNFLGVERYGRTLVIYPSVNNNN